MTNARLSENDEPGGMMAANPNFYAEALWERCVGQCIGENCGRLFISRERYDEHIAPIMNEHTALAERLKACEADVNRFETACEEIKKDGEYVHVCGENTAGLRPERIGCGEKIYGRKGLYRWDAAGPSSGPGTSPAR